MSQTDTNDLLDGDLTGRDGACPGLTFSTTRTYLFLALAAVITVALYLPHLATVFVDWDLVAYRRVLYTTDYWNTAIELFTDFQGKVVAGYYAPVASISMMMDKWLIGQHEASAWFTLLVNLLVHCANGMLVFLLLRGIGVGRMTALLSATIFLIHPLQVSSVLWFSQRKGLLATMFYLLSYLGYLKYTDQRTLGPYLGSLALFAIALLTKPTVVVLPLALLVWQIMVFLRNQRSQGPEMEDLGQAPTATQLHRPAVQLASSPSLISRMASFVRSALPLVPFFLAALISGLAAVQSEGVSMDVEGPPEVPLQDRPFIAASAIWFYVGKAVMPTHLTPIYPRWDIDSANPVWWLPLLALLLVFVILIRYRDWIGMLPFWCIANFLVPLIPVIGLMKFAYLRLSYVSDHFVYLPMVGMAGLLGVSVMGLVSCVRPRVRTVLAALTVVYLGFLGFQTWSYGAAWKDSVTFWSYNLVHNPRSWSSQTYLGHALVTAGRAQEAIPHFEQAITLKRDYVRERLARGEEFERSGNAAAAQREATQAANVQKTLAISYHNLGNALLLSNQHARAMKQYGKALELQPNQVRALTNLGVCHLALHNFPDAVRNLTRAVELSPNNFEAQYNLGYALRMLGHRTASDKHFARARSLRPDVPLPEFPQEGLPANSPSLGNPNP